MSILFYCPRVPIASPLHIPVLLLKLLLLKLMAGVTGSSVDVSCYHCTVFSNTVLDCSISVDCTAKTNGLKSAIQKGDFGQHPCFRFSINLFVRSVAVGDVTLYPFSLILQNRIQTIHIIFKAVTTLSAKSSTVA